MEIFLNTLLWLIVGSLVVGGLWLWLQPFPHNPLRGWILAAQILIAAVVPAMLLAVVWFKPENLGFIGLDGGVLLAALILLLWGSLQGCAYEQEIRQLQSGRVLARWECTVAEYRRFLKNEVARLQRDASQFVRYSFGFAGAAVILFVFISGPVAWMMGGLLLAGGLLVSLITYLQFLSVKAHHAAHGLEAGEILFGPSGVLIFGRFIPLRGFNLWLEKVAYIAQEPPRLHFVSAYRRRRGKGTREVYIPVPAKYRTEAKALVTKYKEGARHASVTPGAVSEKR
jgi:hypothetical protein